ncbi:MAG TPA: PTS sugar transporter subunit IIA [Fibrobacteraceae bacterium]|nr:PTS sugar transporter subunit IIA [Fibrobacteraceae bacterium]
MRLSERLVDNGIIINSECQNKAGILREMVDVLAQAFSLKHRDEILEAVLSREKQKSTGIGCGLAVPHAKVDYVDRMCMVAATVPKGIDFDTLDKEPVYLLMLIVSPSNTVGPHIKALSSVARIMADAEVRNDLIQAKTVADFMSILRAAEDKYL